ncbi:hypothetical protein TWF694_007988 [Orbilia ellipsospora]|uniref:PA14 domain-containing protein n=1 Tax=Orbilia ellipsospora TaxID=2528407 RepID=A0AAV9XEQ9_9PEZI
MLVLQGILQLVLAGAAVASTCGKPPSSCKSISTKKPASSSCSKYFQSHSISVSTCTSTSTKAAATTTTYIKKGKATCTHWKTSTSVKSKTVNIPACDTATFGKTVTKWSQKTKWFTCTEISTVRSTRTSRHTTTKTITKTKTITGVAPAKSGSGLHLLKRGPSLPNSCSCFATKTHIVTKTPAVKTKTIDIASSTVQLTKTTKITVTRTKTIANAGTTKYTTKTEKHTSTHYATTSRTVKVTSTVVKNTTTTKTVTKTVTKYVSPGTTTVTRIDTKAHATTIKPAQGTGKVTVVKYITRSTKSITKVGTKPGTRRDTPTAITAPVTFIKWVAQVTVSVTRIGTSEFTSIAYPTDSNGKPITTGFTVTAIEYITQPVILITEFGTTTGLTTLYPTDSNGNTITDSGTKTIITFATQPYTTVTRLGSSAYVTTVFPTDSSGHTIIDGSHTVSVIDFVTQPTVTITRVGPSLSTTTQYPTNAAGSTISDGSGTVTVIDFKPQPTVTAIKVGTAVFATTIFPNPTDISGTISVIDYVTQPVTTIRSLASTASTTTIFPAPTDVTGTITVIQYFTQPVTLVTKVATTTGLTTVFPTDSNGHVITDGSGTETIITYITQQVVTKYTTGPNAGVTTQYPTNSAGMPITDGSGILTVIVTEGVTTITTHGPVAGTTTKYPTDAQGNTVSSGTISVIVTELGNPPVTVITTGPAAGRTTIFPTDGSGKPITDGSSGTATVRITQPVVTITTSGPVPGTGTEYPTNSVGSTLTDGSGTLTIVVTQAGGSAITIVTTGPVPGQTTKYPTNGAGVPITDGSSGTVTVVVTEAVVLVTTLGSIGGTSTQYPTNMAGSTITDGSGTITVIVTRPVVTKTVTGPVAGITTQYPTDSTGHTLSDGTVTVVITTPAGNTGINTRFPSVTKTIITPGPTAGTSTAFPTNSLGSTLTDGSGTLTIIITEAITTVTRIASTTGLSTQYPTDASGHTLTDGSGTISVIFFKVQPTVTLTMHSTTHFTTTVFPTDSTGHTITYGDLGPGGTVTEIVYVTQPITTITVTGPKAGTTTEYPTNSAGSTITDGSGTITVVVTSPAGVQATVTTVVTGSADGSTTQYPTDATGGVITNSGTATVVITQAVTTVLTQGPVAGTTTRYPTNSNGSTVTNPSGFGTITVVITSSVAGQITVTTVISGPEDGSTTQYPTDSAGSPITTGGTATVVITQAVVTVTATGPVAGETTQYPTDSSGHTVTNPSGSGTITVVITHVPGQPFTVITTGPVPGTTTRYPTDSAGNTVTTGDYTVVITEEVTTVTRVASTTGLTTAYPTDSNGSTITDGSGTITVITYVKQPITTLTVTGSVAGTTTLYPTNSAGSTITDGSGTITVEITQTPGGTQTIFTTGPVGGRQTQYPTNSAGSTITDGSGGPATVRITQPVVFVTVPGASAGTTTKYPTNSAGSTISDDSGTITVQVTTPVSGHITTVITQGPQAGTTTEVPTDSAGSTILGGTTTVVITQAVVTSFTTGPAGGTTTKSPTDSSGSTLTDGQGTIVVVITQPVVTSVTTGPIAGTTTESPTDSAGSTLTNGQGTLTIVITQPVVFSFTTGPSGGTTTESPTDSAGSTLTNGQGTLTVVITQPVVTTTVTGSVDGTTTEFPTNTAGSTIRTSGTITVVVTQTPIGVPFTCNTDGYYVGEESLYKYDLTSSSSLTAQTVVANFTTADMEANCLGYNKLDNYLYAVQLNTTSIIRISSDGVVSNATSLPANYTTAFNIGDIDEDGQYWIAETGGEWHQINLGASNFGQVVNSGNFELEGFIFDWSYIPSAGRYLWSVALINDTTQELVRFDMSTHVWTSVASFQVNNTGYAATFANNNGDLYLGGASTEDLYKVNVFNPVSLAIVGTTPDDGSGNSDGARCLYNDTAPSRTTVITAGPTGGTQTILPTDTSGVTITNPTTGTITVVITQAITTVVVTDSTTGVSTVFPTDIDGHTVTDGSGTVSVIKHVVEPYTTITIGGLSSSTTTVFPTDSMGLQILDGTHTATVINFRPAPSATAASGPPFDCSPYGYFINNADFWRLNVTTSGILEIKASIDGATAVIGAIGYNTIDNYIYGVEKTTGKILKIASDGTLTQIGAIATLSTVIGGDVDNNGQLWIAGAINATNLSWAQIDVDPNSSNYGQLLNSGVTNNPGPYFEDFVHIPSAGNFLWGITLSSTNYPILVKFDMATHTWVNDTEWTTVPGYTTGVIGSMFGADNGDIWFLIDQSGVTWKTNIFTKQAPVAVLVPAGYTATQADGARCVYGSVFAHPKPLADSLPELCGNLGLDIAIFDMPDFVLGTTPYPLPETFKTLTPYDTTKSNVIGFVYSDTAPVAPYGFAGKTHDTVENVFYMGYKGYFYAPISQNYSITLGIIDNWAWDWWGPLAYAGWNGTNAYQSFYDNYATGVTDTISLYIEAGTYLPVRISHENGGGPEQIHWTIKGQDNIGYVQYQVASPYLVYEACSPELAPAYPPWGNEDPPIITTTLTSSIVATASPTTTITLAGTSAYTTTVLPTNSLGSATVSVIVYATPGPLPDTSCGNAGWEVAIFNEDYTSNDIESGNYNSSIFAYQLPYGTNVTDYIGVAAPGFTPQGFHINSTDTKYTMQYRGYFYAPKTDLYTFTLFNINDIGLLWTDGFAIIGYNNDNAAAKSTYGAGGTVSKQIMLQAGEYHPIRVQHCDIGNQGSISFTVQNSTGSYFVANLQPSEYLVLKSCDLVTARPYQPWGSEFVPPLPETTVTRVTNTVSTTTMYPTDQSGVIASTGTITVIDYITPTITTFTVGGTAAAQTILPSDTISGTTTVISYRPLPSSMTSFGKPFDCDKFMYVTRGNSLTDFGTLDVTTGNQTLIRTDALNTGHILSPLAYNALDNFIYAGDYQTGSIFRMAQDGTVTLVTPYTNNIWLGGDIDNNGQYFMFGKPVNGLSTWVQINLNPFSGAYNETVKSGTIDASGANCNDWAFVVSAGPYFWCLASHPTGGYLLLTRFDPANGNYTVVHSWTDIISGTAGGVVAGDATDIYGYIATTGKVYHVDLITYDITLAVETLIWPSTEATRCMYYGITVPQLPDTSCNNTGFEAAIWHNPYPNTGDQQQFPVTGFDTAYFKTNEPFANTTTNVIGCTGGCSNPYNFIGHTAQGDEYVVSIIWRGFFYAPVTETYTFDMTGINDGGWEWKGATAYSGWTVANADAKATGLGPPYPHDQFSVTIEAGTYYPIRLQWANGYGGGLFTWKVTDSKGKIYVGEVTASPYLVWAVCDGSVAPFANLWGHET